MRDDDESRVIVTLCDLEWRGIIYMDHETHIIEPIDGTTAHVIYREADDSALSKYTLRTDRCGCGNTSRRSTVTGCNYRG